MNEDELTEEDVIRYLEECNESQDIHGFCYIPAIVCSKILDLYQKEKERNKEFLSNKMTLEEAKQIIDDMYQDKYKPIEEKTKEGVTIYIERLDNVIFSEVEFAGVRLLREVQILERKLKNSISKDKIREKIKELEDIKSAESIEGTLEEIKLLKELLEENNEM